jgi:hypothetical protein
VAAYAGFVRIAALALVACAGGPAFGPAPEFVLLAPPNFGRELPETFAEGPPVLSQELRAALEARGVRVFAPDRAEFGEVWEAATGDVGTLLGPSGDFDAAQLDRALRALVETWASRGVRFDRVLLPQLELRSATIAADGASWDGVKRRVEVDRSKAGKALWTWPNRESATCLSLRLLVYAGDGRRLYDRYGGLEVVHRYRSSDLSATVRWDLFSDRAAVREGVEIALAPLFGG